MPTIQTARGPVSYAVLIPSKGRAAQWAKTITKMPWLNDPHTVLGLEVGDYKNYDLRHWKGQILHYENDLGSVAVARQNLLRHGLAIPFNYYVVTDDNAAHKSQDVLHNLVRACAEYRTQPCVMAGYHNTAEHFDRGKIGKAITTNGLRTYPGVAMILQCYPRELYEKYTYPADSYGLDDRHFALWALKKGASFAVCMDAPFTKTRYQKGGQGPVETRARKTGLAIARLALDFPEYVGAVGTLRIPWQFLLDARAQGGITANRLVGGAMRKEQTLNKPIIVKRRPRL